MESRILRVESFGVVDGSHVAHVRGDGGLSLCGKRVVGDVPTGGDAWRDGSGYHDGQHCVTCTDEYVRAFGFVPVTFDF